MAVKLNLKKFDPKTMANDSVVLIIGKRRSGKSYISRDLLYHKRAIPVGVAMSGTEDGNHFFSSIIPDSFVYGKYDAEVLQKLLKRQKVLVNKNHPLPNAFVVLDDCAYDPKMLRGNTPMREVLFNGRHWRLFTIITLQYLMVMPPDMRQNIDYVIVLKDNVLKNLRKLHDNFFGIVDDFNNFVEIMRQVTEDHGALVLDNTSNSNDLSSMLYWYKAKERCFKMGSIEFWKEHLKNYNPHHDVETDEEQPLAGKKKSGLMVNKM